MHIDKQKDHCKSPQRNTAYNAITDVSGEKQGEIFQGNKTKGKLRVRGGNSIIIARDLRHEEVFTNLIPITFLKSSSNDLFIYL